MDTLTTHKKIHWFVSLLLLVCCSSVLLSSHSFAKDTVTYYHNDLQGNAVAATNEKGDVIWRKQYDPFGNVVAIEGDTVEAKAERKGYTGHIKDNSTGLVNMGARYYNPKIGVFYAYDPAPVTPNNPFSFSRYAYANQNPYRYVDPDGRSPVSVLAKQTAKHGIRKGLQKMGQRQIRRLGRHMSQGQRKEFMGDVADVIGSLDSSPLEIAVELIPVAGDIYGGAKFGKQVANAYGKMQDLENRWAEKIFNSLPLSQREKFVTAMRNAGVRDAKQDSGLPRTGSGLDGHHRNPVKGNPSQMSDPRNIQLLSPTEHRKIHSGQ